MFRKAIEYNYTSPLGRNPYRFNLLICLIILVDRCMGVVFLTLATKSFHRNIFIINIWNFQTFIRVSSDFRNSSR